MTTAEQTPILIPSEDEDDDDIVVVKEETVPITIDETEDQDQDAEVIFISQTKPPALPPSPLSWDTDMDSACLAADLGTEAAEDVGGGAGTTLCTAGLSAIGGVGSSSRLSPEQDAKHLLHRNLSVTSSMHLTLSLSDSDQTPLDLSKTTSDHKDGVGSLVSDSDAGMHATDHFVGDLGSSSFEDSNDDSISFDQVDNPAAAAPAVLMQGTSAPHALTSVIASPFPVPSCSQASGSLDIASSNGMTSSLQILKSGRAADLLTPPASVAAVGVTDVLVDLVDPATCRSQPGVDASSLPSTSQTRSATIAPGKLPPTLSSSATEHQLLVDFLMQGQSVPTLLEASGATSIAAASTSGVAAQQPQSLPTGSSSAHLLYQAQTSVSGVPLMVGSRQLSHSMSAPGDSGIAGVFVPNMGVVVAQTSTQQPVSAGTNLIRMAPAEPFNITLGTHPVQQQTAMVSLSPQVTQLITQALGSNHSMPSSQMSIPSSLSPQVPPAASSSPSLLLPSLCPSKSLSISTGAAQPSLSPIQQQLVLQTSVPATTVAMVTTTTDAVSTAVCPGTAILAQKRSSTSAISLLDNSSLPLRKRVRPVVNTSSAPPSRQPSDDAAQSNLDLSGRDRDGGSCQRCGNSIFGTQLSRCTQGHCACGQCLEEQVKLVLTGRQKESLTCIAPSCGSYYPMSELKHSLPNMVVEILEDKLDCDYVNVISEMMLINATANIQSTTPASTSTATTAASVASCSSASASTSLPSTKTSSQVQTDDKFNATSDTDEEDQDDGNGDEEGDDESDGAGVSSTTPGVTGASSKVHRKRSLHRVKHPGSRVPKKSPKSTSRMVIDSFDDTDDEEEEEDEDEEDLSDLELLEQSMTEEVAGAWGSSAEKGEAGEGKRCAEGKKERCQKDVPDNWVDMDANTLLLAVPLKPDSTEYIEVAFRFYSTMKFPQADVTRILRIQNPILWKYYSLKRVQMVQENDGLSVEEKQLFHGTRCSVIDAICKKGFDWRVCGKHGVAYGHGCYFARDSMYSHNYTERVTEALQCSEVLRSVASSAGPAGQESGFSKQLAPSSSAYSPLKAQHLQGSLQASQQQPQVGAGSSRSWPFLCSLTQLHGRLAKRLNSSRGSSNTSTRVHPLHGVVINSRSPHARHGLMGGSAGMGEANSQNGKAAVSPRKIPRPFSSPSHRHLLRRLFATMKSSGTSDQRQPPTYTHNVTAMQAGLGGSGIVTGQIPSSVASSSSSTTCQNSNAAVNPLLLHRGLVPQQQQQQQPQQHHHHLSSHRCLLVTCQSGSAQSAPVLPKDKLSVLLAELKSISANSTVVSAAPASVSSSLPASSSSSPTSMQQAVGRRVFRGLVSSPMVGLPVFVNPSIHAPPPLGQLQQQQQQQPPLTGATQKPGDVPCHSLGGILGGHPAVGVSGGLAGSAMAPLHPAPSCPIKTLPFVAAAPSSAAFAAQPPHLPPSHPHVIHHHPHTAPSSRIPPPPPLPHAPQQQTPVHHRISQSHLPPWVLPPAAPPPSTACPLPDSNQYTAGLRHMFLAKVLVGRSTGGNVGLRRPPPLDQNEPFGKCYDSCVDNIFDPKIFVIFDTNQAYPEYIIEYKFVE